MERMHRPHRYSVNISKTKRMIAEDWGHYRSRPEREVITLNFYYRANKRSDKWLKNHTVSMKRKVLINLLRFLDRIHSTKYNLKTMRRNENDVEI